MPLVPRRVKKVKELKIPDDKGELVLKVRAKKNIRELRYDEPYQFDEGFGKKTHALELVF